MSKVSVTHEQIYAQLTEIFRDVFDNDSITLHEGTTASDVPGWDSLNHINMIAAAELRFGIKFKTAELESLRNVGQLVDVIAQKKK